MDPCLTNPCRNGGTCQSQLQGGLLTSLSHMSVFGPYDCGPYDTESHCGQGGGQTAPAHHQEMFNEHEVDHQSEFPQEVKYYLKISKQRWHSISLFLLGGMKRKTLSTNF